MADTGACLVIGAGDDTGAAVGRAFAREGLVACLVRRERHADQLEMLAQSIRDEGLEALAMPADGRDEEAVIALVDRIEREVGPLEVAVFNVGANVSFPITEMTAQVYKKVWEMACFAGFLMGREAARRMVPRGRGTIIFTGATASTRGRPGMAAFAGAKHGLRALSQSMATSFARTCPASMTCARKTPSSTLTTLQPTTSCCTGNRATPGPMNSICVRGRRTGKGVLWGTSLSSRKWVGGCAAGRLSPPVFAPPSRPWRASPWRQGEHGWLGREATFSSSVPGPAIACRCSGRHGRNPAAGPPRFPPPAQR